MLTIHIPLGVARFIYSAIEHLILNGNLATFKPRVSPKLKEQLVELSDELALQISMEGVR